MAHATTRVLATTSCQYQAHSCRLPAASGPTITRASQASADDTFGDFFDVEISSSRGFFCRGFPWISSTSGQMGGRHRAGVQAASRLDAISDLQTLASRLPLMPAHDSLFLLRNVVTTPRLVLRTAP